LHLASVNRAQVSMNLTNFEEIPLDDLYRTIEQEAAKRGTSIAESELIGFVPRAAFDKSPEFFRRTWAFEEARIIENRIFRR
jgi:glutamate formiminotransferase